MALEMSQEFPTVSLDITNVASPRLSLVEKFAKIAVYKWICRSSHWHPNQLSAVFAIFLQTASFFIFTDRSIRLTA